MGHLLTTPWLHARYSWKLKKDVLIINCMIVEPDGIVKRLTTRNMY